MMDKKEPFEREKLDEEIEQLLLIQDPELLLEKPEARLANDLHRAHQAAADADRHSLSHVYARLRAREEAMHATSNVPDSIDSILPFSSLSHSSQKGVFSVKDSVSRSTYKPDVQQRPRFTAAVAVLAAAVLLAAAFWTFTQFRSLNQKNTYVAQTGVTQKDIHISRGSLLCHAAYGSESIFSSAQPPLDWSARGILLTANPTVKTYAAQNCAPAAIVGQPKSIGLPIWSPDGQRMVLLGGNTEQVLDASTGQVLNSYEDRSVLYTTGAAWTSDSKQVITADIVADLSPKTTRVKVQIRNSDTWKVIRTAFTFVISSKGLWLSPDGKYLALQTSNYQIEFWNIATGKLISTAPANTSLEAVAWSPDGTSFAGAIANSSWPEAPSVVQVWSIQTGKPTASFKDDDTFQGNISGLAWSPDGKYLAEGSGEIHIWNMESGQLDTTFGKITTKSDNSKMPTYSMIISVAWSPDSSKLASVTSSFSSTNPNDANSILNVWQLS